MSQEDREHFEQYRDQTRLKHEILAAYLPAFFHILKRYKKNLNYIDAFAGRGHYTDQEQDVPGSPLLALELIAGNAELAEKVSTLFIEADPENYAQLETAVHEFYDAHSDIREPILQHGTFANVVTELLDTIESLAPTFLFVDPRGIKGASFEVMKRVMDSRSCEAFVFFNLEAVRRVAGLEEVNEHLVDLYGSTERAEEVFEAIREIDDVHEREDFIISEYRRAFVEEIGAEYVVAFRVEHESRRTTSHFFVHATKHPLGFAIMKDIMWPRGRSDEGRGGLEFIQASNTNIQPLLLIDWSELKDTIVASLDETPTKVSTFYEEWVCRPDDMYCRKAYRQALLELEEEQRIEVTDKEGIPKLADKRRRLKGRPTLGKYYFVRLP